MTGKLKTVSPVDGSVYVERPYAAPEDIAQAVLFFASDASSWITGQTIIADGGGEVGFPHG